MLRENNTTHATAETARLLALAGLVSPLLGAAALAGSHADVTAANASSTDDDAVRISIARRSTFKRLPAFKRHGTDWNFCELLALFEAGIRDLPTMTGSSIIEQGKQLIGAADVDYVVSVAISRRRVDESLPWS